METIGVIGLGRMGTAIAQRMAMQGKSVQGWTRSGRTVEGVVCVSSLEQLVEQCDTLILSLLDDIAVREVLGELVTLNLNGKQIIDTSTVTPEALISHKAAITNAGATAVDAPISGGPELVLAGKCGVFVGGEDEDAARAQTCLSAISGRIFHVGPLGTGLVMKVINNGMLQAYTAGLSDLLPLAQRAGLSLETALQILSSGPAGVPFISDRMPKIVGEDDTVGFAVSAIFKDNTVFRNVLNSYGLSSPILDTFAERRTAMEKANLMERDPAAILRDAYCKGSST